MLDENRFNLEIQHFEELDRIQPPPTGAILFVGSSTITLWNATVPEDFAPLTAFGRGFGGSTIAEVNYFARQIVLPYAPKIIVFYAGENDLASGKTPEEICADFREFVRLVHAELPDTRILYLSMKPSPIRMSLWEAMQRGNALIQEVTAGNPLLGYIDIVPLMMDADGQPRAELYCDNLHMVREAYLSWIPVIKAHLETVSGSVQE